MAFIKDLAKLLKSAVNMESDIKRLAGNIDKLVGQLEKEREARTQLEHRITRLEAKEEAFNQMAGIMSGNQPNNMLPPQNSRSAIDNKDD